MITHTNNLLAQKKVIGLIDSIVINTENFCSLDIENSNPQLEGRAIVFIDNQEASITLIPDSDSYYRRRLMLKWLCVGIDLQSEVELIVNPDNSIKELTVN